MSNLRGLTQADDMQTKCLCVAFPTVGLVCVWIETKGTGTLWVDDVQFSRIEP